MSIFASEAALAAWNKLGVGKRARTLATSYYAPVSISAYGGNDDKDYKHTAVNVIVSAASEEAFCTHWRDFLKRLPENHSTIVRAKLRSRLLVNMAGSVLENAGISLEFACGVPVIPGSAVKGLVRRYALALLEETPDEQKQELFDLMIRVFGCIEADFESKGFRFGDLSHLKDVVEFPPENARKRIGGVCFLQAVPGKNPSLCADVLTPHHMKYMSGGTPNPSDDENPVPNFFPAVKADGKTAYYFALYSQDAELLKCAGKWLTESLRFFAIGAKGSAGYGYFEVCDEPLSKFISDEQAAAMEMISRKEKVGDMFINFHKEVQKKPHWCWALLYCSALPEEDPRCRRADYLAFLRDVPTEKQKIKNRRKAEEAIRLYAEQHHITLPQL